jgi:hypothetical protein
MLVDSMPSQPMKNCMFKNEGEFRFSLVSDEWGFENESYSNGSAYGDLDNDGDLDLVVNNVNMPCFVYRNNTDTITNRSLRVVLQGSGKNSQAIGSRITAKYQGKLASIEHFPSKGFQSCMEDVIHLGVGNANVIDSLEIRWPDGTVSNYANLPSNKTYTFSQRDSKKGFWWLPKPIAVSPCDSAIAFTHRDVDINFFTRERLLLEMNGFDGPALASADVNGDKIADLFCGGGRNQGSVLFLSGKTGTYIPETLPFAGHARSEVVDATFFDSDNDGDLDLYVAHGGKSFSIYAPELHDVLYVNDGQGHFAEKANAFPFPYPIWTGAVAIGDINGDGWNDVVVAEKMKTDLYGLPGSIFIFINSKQNQFTLFAPPGLKDIGMVSDVALANLNGDALPDLVFCGQWMSVFTMLNDGKSFMKGSPVAIPESRGMWNVAEVADIDGDGDEDVIAGNKGANQVYSKGLRMFMYDFDNNGTTEQIVCQADQGKYYPIHDLDELFSQLPILRKRFIKYNQCARADMDMLFGPEILASAAIFDLDELSSGAYLQEKGVWKWVRFPAELQYSSIHALHSSRKGKSCHLLAGGNDYRVKPQFGRQDASQGWRINCGVEKGRLAFTKPTPLFIQGEIRDIVSLGSSSVVFGLNNKALQTCKIE